VNHTIAPPGAARERTSLAWRRTSLAFAVNSILLLRSPDAWLQVAALTALAAAAGIAAVSSTSFRNPDTRGWFAGGDRRAEVLALLAAAVGILDLIAITR
jgi:uncharacterized membrane protein YidH (DUF202 family)